jgi:hypothetical protein
MKLQSKPTLRFEASELRRLAKRSRPTYERDRALLFMAAGVPVGAILVAIYRLLTP